MNRARLSAAVMQGLLLLLLAVFFWQAWSMAAHHAKVMEQARRQEVWSVQLLAGALVEVHPELEGEIAAALGSEDAAHYQQAGEAALRKYGYGWQTPLRAAARYERLQAQWNRQLILFVTTVAGGLVLLRGIYAWRGRLRNSRLLAVIEQYLAEDYSFAASLEPLFGKRRTGQSGQLSDLIKQLGNLIAWKNRRLTEEQESTKSLVTDISHQLKTPIASLKTCFSLYLEADDDAEREEFLQRSHLQMDKLEELTGALMNISRLEVAMIELHPQPTDLREILIRAVNGVYDKALRKDIEMELLPFADVALPLDAKWTAEAIMNVLDNAVKYSPAATCITIAVEERTSFVRVEIADAGIGVPREERARIFQRFYRGGHAWVKATEGSGVGLYLTRMLLENQGGSISVKAAPAQGAVFVIQLRKR